MASDLADLSCFRIDGYVATIVAEELGLDYEVKAIDIMSNEQKEPWFLKICRELLLDRFVRTYFTERAANGRIPARMSALIGGLKADRVL
jgi:hypothetical protein